MSKVIEIDALASEIQGVLDNYNSQIIKGVKKETKRAMKDLVTNTKADAPVGKRKQHYKDSITSKKVMENSDSLIMRWYVKGSDYRLTHLLENGHATRNGGRTKAFKFVSKNVDRIEKWYLPALKGVIENG